VWCTDVGRLHDSAIVPWHHLLGRKRKERREIVALKVSRVEVVVVGEGSDVVLSLLGLVAMVGKLRLATACRWRAQQVA